MVLRVEDDDPQLLALEPAHLEDQAVGDVTWAADRPARGRPVGEQPPTELEGGDELRRLSGADTRQRRQLDVGRTGQSGKAVVGGQRVGSDVDGGAATDTATPDRAISSALVRPPGPRRARRSRGRSVGGSSRIVWPPDRVGTDGSAPRPPATGRSGAPRPGRRRPADSLRHPDLEDARQPTDGGSTWLTAGSPGLSP